MLTLPANPDTAFGGVSQSRVTGKLASGRWANTPRQGPPVRFFIFYGPLAIPEVSRLDRQDEMQARGVHLRWHPISIVAGILPGDHSAYSAIKLLAI